MIRQTQPGGMSRAVARRVELSIIGLCVAAIVMIFQPFSQTLFSIGAGLVVLGGLSFNLVPLCKPGRTVRSLVMAGLTVLAILVVVFRTRQTINVAELDTMKG